MIQWVPRAESRGDAPAIIKDSQSRSYADLLDASERFASALLDGKQDLDGDRVAFLVPSGFDYAAVQQGIWRAGGVAVPLSQSATRLENEYVLGDSQASVVVAAAADDPRLGVESDSSTIRRLTVETGLMAEPAPLPDVEPGRPAMIVYTSGTTNKPKGVVTTHANIQAQIESLVEAWEWRSDDRIPLFLPLHHVHGIVNVLGCALWSGASVEAFDSFDLSTILDKVAAKEYTLFMAVPTIYVKLIQAFDEATKEDAARYAAGFGSMRLMVSGSAALPASIHEKWTELTGQKLLERYGMTEIGMALGNPLHGERRPGAVGVPFPKVSVRLVSETGEEIDEENRPGEIHVKGPTVFNQYWRRPEATSESFTDGWFRTGDMAVLEDGYYRIMGRLSVDIIKSGGYKLSALEIEETLRTHPAISECAVVGVADETWGEAVAAAVILKPGKELSLESLRDWGKERLSKYKVPSRLLVVDELPRNAMGKVTKPAVRDLFAS